MGGVTCDTSILVPALTPWHALHEVARAELRGCDHLIAHTMAETVSVLSRLPVPGRVAPTVVVPALRAVTRTRTLVGLDPTQVIEELDLLATRGVGGGAVHDGLIAAAARTHQLTLVSCDVRAQTTYQAVGARCRILSTDA